MADSGVPLASVHGTSVRAVHASLRTVEPVFDQIKQGRGFRQFLLRGLEKVQGEWLLICAGRNLLKLFRHCRPLANTTPPSPLTL